MNEIQEDQMDIFEALAALPVEDRPRFMPEQRLLEDKHFDDKQTNPNFVSYLIAHNKQPGDPYRMSRAQEWIDEHVTAFKQSHGRSEHDMLREIEDWPSKLRIYLRDIAQTNG